jgi:hypothetical protein
VQNILEFASRLLATRLQEFWPLLLTGRRPQLSTFGSRSRPGGFRTWVFKESGFKEFFFLRICKAGALGVSHTSRPHCSGHCGDGVSGALCPGLALNRDPPHLSLPSSRDYRREAPARRLRTFPLGCVLAGQLCLQGTQATCGTCVAVTTGKLLAGRGWGLRALREF